MSQTSQTTTGYPKDFLTMLEWSSAQLLAVIELAGTIKKNPAAYQTTLKGKILGLIFEKNSTRTRVSFEAGMYQLGGQVVVLNSKETQIGRGEPIEDTARVLSSYLDAMMIRTYSDEQVATLAKYASVPVINGLTDLHHPCQVVADLQTLYEEFGYLKGLNVTYIGDGNNMAHSLMIGGAKVGMHVTIACPAGFEPDPLLVETAQAEAVKTGGSVTISHEPSCAVVGAHAVYTDVWASMGFEEEQGVREKAFAADYQVNQQLMQKAQESAIFLHCLPAHRGEEVTNEVLEGAQSRVFQEAENRLHAQKALLVTLLG